MHAPSFFRNPDTNEVVVAQRPNLPLAIFLVATVARWITHWSWLGIVAGIALAIWAILEIVRGDSPFRRVLGAVVLVAMVASRLLA
jgi:hypothetical protein